MFHVQTQRFGTTRQVFTWEDPRKAGFKGDVEDAVILDYDMEAIHSWPNGAKAPEACLGRSRKNAKHYKVFKYRHELDAESFDFVPGTTSVFGSWADYVRIRLDVPNPDEVDEGEWFDYLDNLDEEWRRLRERSPWPEAPKSASRDDVAEWIAKQHFIGDASIREIWYLPHGAPADEIRLLELSERVLGDEGNVEPLDFGLDAHGTHFRLSIADITADQLENIKRDPARLPSGWSANGSRSWGRRGA